MFSSFCPVIGLRLKSDVMQNKMAATFLYATVTPKHHCLASVHEFLPVQMNPRWLLENRSPYLQRMPLCVYMAKTMGQSAGYQELI